MRELSFLRVAALSGLALCAAFAGAEVTWRVSGGVTSVNFLDGLLRDHGIKVTRLQSTAKATARMENPVGFKIDRESSLTLTSDNGRFQLFRGGEVVHSGGFHLAVGGKEYSARDFAIGARGPIEQQGLTLRGGSGSANPITIDLENARIRLGVSDHSQEVSIGYMDMVLNPAWAQKAGRPELAGLLIGTITVEAGLVRVSGSDSGKGGNPGGGGIGPEPDALDIGLSAMSSLQSLGRVGTFPNGRNGLSMSTTSCNYGSVNIPWFEPMDERHPKICLNVYRVYQGRFEHIGVGWLKHGFWATNSGGCGSCQNPGTITLLGPGCSDTYGPGNNGDRFWLGPRNEVNPFTGKWTCTGSWFANYQPDCVRRNNGGGLDPVAHRIEVYDSDLNVTGAQFYYEAYYIAENDTNRYNQIGYRRATATWGGATWSFSTQTPMTLGPAINVWGDMRSTATPRSEGDAIVASQATDLGGGNYRYDYAVYIHDIDRQIREFTIPVALGTNVSGVGFRDIDKDATNDWSWTVQNGKVVWSTQTHQQNPNANSLKYGSVFNFWFTANAAPVSGCSLLGLFKPGTQQRLSAAARVPPPGDTLPETLFVTDGEHFSGTVQSLFAQDGNRLYVTNANEVDIPDAGYEITGTAPCESPSALRLGLVAQSVRPPSFQIVMFWNYDTSQWETIDTRVAPTTETSMLISVTSNAGRFVGPNMELKAKVLYTLINEVVQDGSWVVITDKAAWQVTP